MEFHTISVEDIEERVKLLDGDGVHFIADLNLFYHIHARCYFSKDGICMRKRSIFGKDEELAAVCIWATICHSYSSFHIACFITLCIWVEFVFKCWTIYRSST